MRSLCCSLSPVSSEMSLRTLPTTTLMPNGSARVLRTATVCGRTLRSTKMVLRFSRSWPNAMIIPSAAAVPSSRSEALAMSRPVSEVVRDWKLMSDSSRPARTAWLSARP